MKAQLKHVVRDKDRHGNVRLYYRRDGRKVRLRGPEHSSEFFQDYTAAMMGKAITRKSSTPSVSRIEAGSFHALCISYFGSADFKKLQPRGQRVRRSILERFCQNQNDGDKPFAELEARHLRLRRDAMMDRPEAANNMIKAVRQVYKYAGKYCDFNRNPAFDVEYLKGNPDGFHAWTPEEVKLYESHHPVGTQARLALALALYTGQRRADLVGLGPNNIRREGELEWLVFTQVKNRESKPVHMQIPLMPELRTIIDATGSGTNSFLRTHRDEPFTANGFGNKFRRWTNQAGLKHCAVHGLRKAAASRLAELGCTEQEIMAITGHKTSKEVARYTRSADQKIRATSALTKMSSSTTE